MALLAGSPTPSSTTTEARMDDRELLELAAKAADMEYRDDFSPRYGLYAVAPGQDGYDGWRYWNPLLDDGDALRLAVKLNIDHGNPGMRLSIDWAPADDPYAATRRAIVRAAAQLAKEQ
jgi:hypothetical protein